MTDWKEFQPLYKDVELFAGLDDQSIIKLLKIMKEIAVPKGTTLIAEGDKAESLYLLVEGGLDVYLREGGVGDAFKTLTLRPITSIGEISLLDGQPRSATLIAAEDTIVLELTFKDLHDLSGDRQDTLAGRLKLNLARDIGTKIRNQSSISVKVLKEQLAEAKARATGGIFISSLFVATCAYLFALHIIIALSQKFISTSIITIPVIFVFSGVFLSAIRRSGYSYQHYGLTLAGWRSSLLGSLLYSIPFLILIMAVKIILQAVVPAMADDHLFSLADNLRHGSWSMLLEVIAYCIFSPFQEFIARGSVQTAFADFLVGKRTVAKAILISNLIFSVLHFHLSVIFAILVFIPGIFWGWLFNRQKTLVGVCFSHILIGAFAFWVVGFDTLFK